MADNTCVVYVEPGKVSVENIDYPKLELPPGVPGRNRICAHGVILRVVATNICGSERRRQKIRAKPEWPHCRLSGGPTGARYNFALMVPLWEHRHSCKK
jgi:hypothetical protein